MKVERVLELPSAFQRYAGYFLMMYYLSYPLLLYDDSVKHCYVTCCYHCVLFCNKTTHFSLLRLLWEAWELCLQNDFSK